LLKTWEQRCKELEERYSVQEDVEGKTKEKSASKQTKYKELKEDLTEVIKTLNRDTDVSIKLIFCDTYLSYKIYLCKGSYHAYMAKY